MIEINSILEIRDHLQGLKAIFFNLDEKLWTAFEYGKAAIDEILTAEDISTEEWKQKCLHIYRHHQPDIYFYDGVWELLTELRQTGCKPGIITDGRPEGQRAKIKALGWESMMDCIIVTDELGEADYRKPCGKAFHLMRDMIGNGGYMTMCYIGDNINRFYCTGGTGHEKYLVSA